MKSILLITLFFCSRVFAQATGYEMRINLFKNNVIVASPNVVVEAGQKAVMSEGNSKNEMYFEVSGQETKTRDILLKITVGQLKKSKKTALAKFDKLTKENVDTEIPFENKDKRISKYSMRITVLRKALDSSNEKAPEAGPLLISF